MATSQFRSRETTIPDKLNEPNHRAVGPSEPRIAFEAQSSSESTCDSDKRRSEHPLVVALMDAREPSPPVDLIDASGFAVYAKQHNGTGFLNPTDLRVTDIFPKKVALIGSCFLECWGLHKRTTRCSIIDLIMLNNAAELPELDEGAVEYDLQIIQIPFHSIMPDSTLWPLTYEDVPAHEAAFEAACRQLEFKLRARMQWNIQRGILTFVANFALPQHTPLGRLLPKYDIRNPEHFVYRVNERLESLVRGYSTAFILDIDRISASYGRRYIQDDSVNLFTHNAVMGLRPPKFNRLEPMQAMAAHYEITWPNFLSEAVWAEIVTLYRVAHQADVVKLVIIDLDDTLWEGISGELADAAPRMYPGWAKGLAEALMYLKKRGILLAIASKNDETRVRAIWPRIFGRTLSLKDFAAIRINWQPKPENIGEILSVLNLLPHSAVFIDDNPAERAAAVQAFPDLRVLGRHPYYLRRILLWSAETQVVAVSAESARRTEMTQAQVRRETQRGSLSREEFLRKAAPEITIFWISDGNDKQIPRVLELINRTNQFNTTGERHTPQAMQRFFGQGGRVLAFDTKDTYTDYGLTGAVLVRAAVIEQWVMSCRILGYGIEYAVLARLVARIMREASEVTARMIETELNMPCRDVFSRAGFTRRGPDWIAPAELTPVKPDHVRIKRRPKDEAAVS